MAVGPLRVFVVGLDGATLDLIRPWADEGRLPTLSRLMRDGVSGPLLSTYPPLTGPAWASFMTGKSPAHHGVLEFFRREPGSYRQVLNSRYDIDGKSLWRLLSDENKCVAVMGIPMTYPPEPVNGCLISGLLTPPGSRDFTYPRALLSELEADLGPYRLYHNEKYSKANPERLIREQYEILENNTRAALRLMERQPWDLFVLHFLGTDVVQHEFWHILDANHPQHDPDERRRLGDPIPEFFAAVDAALGRILGALDDRTIVIVMSDHGFGPATKFVSMNTWLLGEGLLRLEATPGALLRRLLFRAGFNYSVAARLLLALGEARQANALGRSRREELQRRVFLSLDDVDWSRTRVYSIGSFGQLYVNLRGREPRGIVSPGAEYEALLVDLAARLHALVDPETGAPVIERVMRREEVFDGPYAGQAPDLMFVTRDMEYKAMGLADFPSPRVFESVYGTKGHHRMNGLLICHGGGVFKSGALAEGARIQDIAPTILYAMDQSVPREMDGRVLLDLFTPEFQHARTETRVGSVAQRPTDASSAYTPEEEAQMMERLRSLGYGL